MNDGTSSFGVGIEFESVLRAISKQIYETPHAFLRENVQNAIDAVRIQCLRDETGPDSPGYAIDVDVSGTSVSVRDRGIGMSRRDLQRYYWTIGSSGKRNDEARKAGCVGMFGIGGFANFGVCKRLSVTSRDGSSSRGTVTSLSSAEIENAGTKIPQVSVGFSDEADPRGTVVVGEMIGEPDVQELGRYLRDFVRYVPIAIRYNGRTISGTKFETLEEQKNLTPLEDEAGPWQGGDTLVMGRLWEDQGHTLVASIDELVWRGEATAMKGRLRFQAGTIDVFKRGFKLCATQVPSTIGVSGRLDCDLFRPTAGRDSLDAETMSLLSGLVSLLEDVAVNVVLKSPRMIGQYTRIFRYITRRGLAGKMENVPVRLADGSELTLGEIRRRSQDSGSSVFFGTGRKQALSQVLQNRGHIVVQLSANRHRQTAERIYLERYCAGKAFAGVVDCTEVYDDLSVFELTFLSEVEQNILRAYDVKKFRLTPGKLTEDIPAIVKEHSGRRGIEIIVDVRHEEAAKLERLGLNPLVYSLISMFCQHYIGPALKKWSPRFFGDGALNLDVFAKKRPELWELMKEDIGTIRRSGPQQVITAQDVVRVNVADRNAGREDSQMASKPHRLLHVIDEDRRTSLRGYYIRLLDRAFRAFGDLVLACDTRGVVWTGNRVTFVASDGVGAQFRYEALLDVMVGIEVRGQRRAEGALEIERPPQALYDGLYLPIPKQLVPYLVPVVDDVIRLRLHCEWIDLRTTRLWEARESRDGEPSTRQ